MVRDTARTYRVLAAEAESRAMTASKDHKAGLRKLAQDWRDLARRIELTPRSS